MRASAQADANASHDVSSISWMATINRWRVKEREESGWLLALINHTDSKERELEIERRQWVGVESVKGRKTPGNLAESVCNSNRMTNFLADRVFFY